MNRFIRGELPAALQIPVELVGSAAVWLRRYQANKQRQDWTDAVDWFACLEREGIIQGWSALTPQEQWTLGVEVLLAFVDRLATKGSASIRLVEQK